LNILITGTPGVGKTTVLNRVKDEIESRGYDVGGIYSPEIKENGERIGFAIKDLNTGRNGILSRVNGNGPRVGKYKVNLKDLEEIGISAVEKALTGADFIIIDEIAPMELKSPKFSRVVEKALDSEISVLAVIHKRSNHPFILKVKNRDDVVVFEVKRENRGVLDREILEALEMDS